MAEVDGDSSQRIKQSREQVSKLHPPSHLISTHACDNENMKSTPGYQETTLTFIFGMTTVLLNRLILKLSDLPEMKFPEKEQDGREPVYKVLKDIRATLEDYALDLQIWSNDLTMHGKFALDILNDKGQDEKRVNTIKLELHDKLIAIRCILMSLAIRFDIPTLIETVSENTGNESEQSNSVDATDIKYDDADFLELHRACIQLKSCIEELQAAKPAIKEAANFSMIKRFPAAEQDRSGSKQKMTPNALCFDGGGVRSYSSLLILKALMKRVELELLAEDASNPEKRVSGLNRDARKASRLRPADVFSFMCGSSSGGLIAIMLGRLYMTIDDCIAEYLQYAKAIFRRPRRLTSMRGLWRPKYSRKDVIKATRRSVGAFDPTPENEKWRRNIFACPGISCRTAVIAWDSERLNSHIFRTYDCFADSDNAWAPLNPGPADMHQIWQIATATTAAPTFFDSAKIDSQVFADGGISANNPTHEALRELNFLHDGKLNDFCVVSIGSGRATHQKKVSRTVRGHWKVLFDAGKQMITQTETTHETVNEIIKTSGGSYFRLNIGLEIDIRLDEWQKLEDIARITHQYLAYAEVNARLEECAKVLARGLTIREEELSNLPNKLKSSVAERTQPSSDSQSPSLVLNHAIFGLRGMSLAKRYIERPVEMEALERALLGQDQGRKVCVLIGLGGIGKTQLALEFARSHCNRFKWVFWLNGSTDQSLDESIADIASNIAGGQNCELDDLKSLGNSADRWATVKAVMLWLSMPDHESWLIVYDNVDQEHQFLLDRFPNADHGSILITTRRVDLGELGTRIRLEPLNNQQALAFFLDSDFKQMEDSPEAQKMIRRLGGLPLALDQTAAYIRQRSLSISEYLILFENEIVPYNYQRIVFATWETSFRHISSQHQDASKLLQLWSCLDNHDLWFGLLTPSIAKHAGEMPIWLNKLASNELEFLDSISHLLKYSLIQRLSDSHGYSMHSLVHVWARTLLEEDSCADFVELATIIVGFAVPSNWEADSWTLRRRLLPHADRCRPMVLVTSSRYHLFLEAVENLGNLYADLGELGKAEELYRLALVRKVEALGPDNLSTADTTHNLGDVLYNQCKYEQAENLYLRTLAVKQKSLGSSHPSTLDTSSRLAQLYHSQSRFARSKETYLHVLSGYEKVLGSQHPSTLSTVINMGCLYEDQGILYEAESMYCRALLAFKNTHGPKGLLELRTISNLGRLRSYQGRLNDAIYMCGEALEGYKKVLGLKHPATLESLMDLGGLYFYRRSLETAEEKYQQALKGYEECFGDDHLCTLNTRRNLAVVLLEQGRSVEAELMFDSAIRGLRKVLGEDHPSTQTSLSDLALTIKSLDKYEQAEMILVRREISYSRSNASTGDPSLLIPMFSLSLRSNRRTTTEKLDQTSNMLVVGLGKAPDAEIKL